MSESNDRTRTEELVMRAVDGVLREEERAELERCLERFPEYRDELDDFRDIKETTDAMTARILADFEREPLRPPRADQALVSFGLLALLVGLLVLLVCGGWLFFSASDVPLWLKVSYGCGGGGSLLLLLYFIRLRLRGRDPYEEIDL